MDFYVGQARVVGGGQGEHDEESGPLAFAGALAPDAAAVKFGEVFDDGEAQAQAAVQAGG